MPYSFPQNQFDPQIFIQDLLKAMQLDHAPQAKQDELKELLERQIEQVILDAAKLYLEPRVIERICEEYAEERDPLFFIRQLIAESPRTQLAILDALSEFYDQMLDAHRALTQK